MSYTAFVEPQPEEESTAAGATITDAMTTSEYTMAAGSGVYIYTVCD